MIEPIPKEKLKSIYNKVSSRYDWQHSLLTLNSDQRGRELVVSETVKQDDNVLDAGSGTGTTALLAAEEIGPQGKVVLYDFSEGMLNNARKKAEEAGLTDRLTFEHGDMTHLPYPDNHFNAALSTYSLCPLYDPAKAAKELYRVVKPGGKIGVAHSAEPSSSFIKKAAGFVEKIIWKIPAISLGCRAVEVESTFKKLGGKILFKKKIGVPLWPFLVFIVEKSSIPPSSS